MTKNYPETALVIAPHPDDEVLGCGGIIAKMRRQGHRTSVLIVTKSYTPEWTEKYIQDRAKEVANSNKVLGLNSDRGSCNWLNFPAARLDTTPQKKLNDALSDHIAFINPDTLFIPHRGDAHKDHRIVHEAALIAARPAKNNNITKVLVYETLSETEWGVEPFTPNHYEILSYEDIQIKLEAAKKHKTEMRAFPHPRSLKNIRAKSQIRGSEICHEFAEAFMVIREILT